MGVCVQYMCTHIYIHAHTLYLSCVRAALSHNPKHLYTCRMAPAQQHCVRVWRVIYDVCGARVCCRVRVLIDMHRRVHPPTHHRLCTTPHPRSTFPAHIYIYISRAPPIYIHPRGRVCTYLYICITHIFIPTNITPSTHIRTFACCVCVCGVMYGIYIYVCVYVYVHIHIMCACVYCVWRVCMYIVCVRVKGSVCGVPVCVVCVCERAWQRKLG